MFYKIKIESKTSKKNQFVIIVTKNQNANLKTKQNKYIMKSDIKHILL